MTARKHSTVVILDYGSQYTQLIARRVRELGIYSRVLSGDASLARIQELDPKAVILSGGPSSVYDAGAPTLPAGFLEEQRRTKLPTLGVCYGMQLLVRDLGGKVDRAEKREYGKMDVHPESGSRLFSGRPKFSAWMSHGDESAELPKGFRLAAKSAAGAVAAAEAPELGLYGLQFHPEVTHTERGMELLRAFLLDIAGIRPDWTMGSVIEEQVERIRDLVPPGEHALCALSGGVDSAVAAVLVHKALGDRLHCVFVDHGLLRFQERERVNTMFREKLHLPVETVDASARVLGKLAGVADPEKKRKIIGSEFISVFDEAADRIGKKMGKTPRFLVQGTLYPDVIESSPAPSDGPAIPGKKHSHTIKSHHNVGGLPKDLKFTLIEPLRDLFKDEVRRMGKELGVPEEFLARHPFPGPGLAVRIIGDVTPEAIDILQRVDEVFIQGIREAGLYSEIWQAFAVFLPIRSVGVQGDGRTHDHVVALRAVTSTDGMTADWYRFPHDVLARISTRICNEVRGVNRVVYDVSSKPPATIEWE
ncbi:MAG: glutamine-hydrolyzing GMP synthase [Bdellovibrionales bacterium]|nr:glutamine-hydrolyzing GMP synthase [Bdellovibrionales bacterium]